MTSDPMRELPTEWTGTWSWSNLGAFSFHHDEFDPHDDAAFEEWNTLDQPITLRIVLQTARHLQILITSPKAETRAVGTLASDGRTLALTTTHGSYTLIVDGTTMSGTGHSRAHDAGGEHERFGAGIIELHAAG